MAIKLIKDRCYHVEGWKKATQFRLLDWNEEFGTAVIQRPKSGGKKWRVPISKLRNTIRHGANKVPLQNKTNDGGRNGASE